MPATTKERPSCGAPTKAPTHTASPAVEGRDGKRAAHRWKHREERERDVLYKAVPLEDGEELQYLGVYVLKWQREWGDPAIGFVELDMAAVIESVESLINHVMAQEEKAEPMSAAEVRVAIRQCLEAEQPV